MDGALFTATSPADGCKPVTPIWRHTLKHHVDTEGRKSASTSLTASLSSGRHRSRRPRGYKLVRFTWIKSDFSCVFATFQQSTFAKMFTLISEAKSPTGAAMGNEQSSDADVSMVRFFLILELWSCVKTSSRSATSSQSKANFSRTDNVFTLFLHRTALLLRNMKTDQRTASLRTLRWTDWRLTVRLHAFNGDNH